MAGYTPAALSNFRERTFAMEEIWKDIEGYGGKYQVSNFGRVRRCGKRILKPQARNHGYLSVWLYDGHNHGKQVSIHRLVAQVFIPNPCGLPEVNHLDENKQNNAVDNLMWCSHKDNSSFGSRGERIGLANTNGKRSKPIAQYTLDGELVRIYPSIQEAHRNGYGCGNVYKCLKGTYSHAYGYKWQYAS